MQEHRPSTPHRGAAASVALGALAGAALTLLLGASIPGPAVPPGRTKPTPDQVSKETAAAMSVLNQFVGRWDIKGQSFDENDKPVGDFTGSATWAFTLDNNFLMGETTLQGGSYVLEQVDYIGYSPGLRKYTHVMMTELDKSMVYQHGEWMPEVGAFVFAMAAPLDTPTGTPRSVGMQYAFSNAGIAVNMTLQSGMKPARNVRLLMTRSTTPDAPTGADGMPTGGNVRVQYQQGDPAKMRAQMQQAIGQMSAQKQAMSKYFQDMNMGWDSQMDQLMEKQVSRGVDDQTREILRGPE
ncbi:MAG: DUF1579 domain-containing protein [Planctomycetes bacterium]|nr:DUF1579 domain-containing protein [Planctomycetota bacterium]